MKEILDRYIRIGINPGELYRALRNIVASKNKGEPYNPESLLPNPAPNGEHLTPSMMRELNLLDIAYCELTNRNDEDRNTSTFQLTVGGKGRFYGARYCIMAEGQSWQDSEFIPVRPVGHYFSTK